MQILFRKSIVFLVLLLVAAGLSGCGQKEEERMLAYMEKKYQEHFAMVGSYGGQLGKGYAMVQVTSRNRPQDLALVRITYENGKNIFQDNYLAYLLREDIEEEIQHLAEAAYGECKVFYKVPEMVFPESFGPDMSAEDFLRHPNSGTMIYVYSREYGKEKEQQLEQFRKLLQKEGYYIKGVVSYPKEEEMYQSLDESSFYRDGISSYRAKDEVLFSMNEKGDFRYARWKGEAEK